MKNTNELKQRTTNEYFGKVFSELYKEWKSKTPDGNQQMFAELCKLGSKNSVSNYARGKSIPTDASVDEIIRVFREAGMNVTIEDFIPHTDADTYRYDPSRAKSIQDHSREFARSIGLSDDFLDFITNYTDFSDPDEGYPIWSPLTQYPSEFKEFKTTEKELEYLNGSFFVSEYHRRPLATTTAVSDDQSFTIPMKDGSSFLMSEIDLRILKDLQDKVVEVIRFHYFKRRKDMQIQEVKATKQANQMTHDEAHNQIIIGHHALSKEELIAIDPYMQYLKFVDENGKEV